MPRSLKRLLGLFLTVISSCSLGWFPAPRAYQQVDFAREIQPILARSCHNCHGPKLQMGRLRLDSKSTALAGGQSGKVIQPGRASDSLLLKRIAGAGDQPRMPMEGDPLTPVEIERIAAWINQGAEWPDGVGTDAAELKKHWAFIPPQRPELPRIRTSAWPRNPIDHFVLARLEKEGLPPSPEADRVTLLRRLSLDLIGLPPTIAQVDAFLANKSPKAY